MRNVYLLIMPAMIAAFATGQYAVCAENLVAEVQKALPQTRIDAVKPSPINGLFEVTADRNIFYLSSDKRHVVVGEIYDLKRGRNITAERRVEVSKIDWTLLPLKSAIKLGKSDTRKLAVFLDPDCPYCREAYKTLQALKDVESYIFLYPLPAHKEAKKKCEEIMCAKNRAGVLDKVMRGEKQERVETNAVCLSALEESIKAARSLRISGTPTFVFYPGGQLVPGVLSAQDIQSFFKGEGNTYGK